MKRSVTPSSTGGLQVSGYSVYILLAVVTALAYARVPTLGFTNFDDPGYVTRNPHVQPGLTGPGIAWAFTSIEQSNWHPLTWLSHMIDCDLFGLNPAGHHVTSLLFHIAAALLLCAALARMTRTLFPAAAVAGLFALHPLHVESVAWVAERKDVLSAFFAMLALYGYARYAERPSIGRYAAVLGSFTLGLLAKPMLVTLPFVFLLLDYWPLRRWRARLPAGRILAEKAPMLVLSAASSAMTYVAQHAGGSVVPLRRLPVPERIANALVSSVTYLRKAIWPFDLAAFYPRATHVEPWKAGLAALLLVSATVVVLVHRRSRPYLPVGWFWYLGTLVPVIGMVQVGEQALADRYTYLPLVGIFVILVWTVSGALRVFAVARPAAAPTAMLVFCALGGLTWIQTGYWKSSQALFEHTIAVTGENELAYLNFGAALASEGKLADAARLFTEFVDRTGGTPDTRADLGMVLTLQGRMSEAEAQYRRALAADPSHPESHNGLAVALLATGRLSEAAAHAQAAVQARPALPEARYNLGRVRAAQGDAAAAFEQFREALRIRPDYAEAQYALGLLIFRQGGARGEAVAHLREAVRLRPGWPEAMNNLAWMLATGPDSTPQDISDALSLAREALRLAAREDAGFLDTMAAACARAGQFAEAVAAADRAIIAARTSGDGPLAAEIESRRARYRSSSDFRELR